MPAGRPRSPKKSPVRAKSPVRTAVKDTVRLINDVDFQPTKEIFMVMNYLSMLFVLTALVAVGAYIYYADKGADTEELGDNAATFTDTIAVSFYGVVISVLLYFVARHHYSHSHN